MIEDKDKTPLWQVHRAIFQATTFKGARYIDDAGKILNEYRDSYHDGTVGVEALNLSFPKRPDYPDQISVDMNRIWMACRGDSSLKRIVDTSDSITKTISRIIEVTSYTRLGLRTVYFKPAHDMKQFSSNYFSRISAPGFHKLIKPESVTELSINTKYKSDPFFIRLMIQPIFVPQSPVNKTDFPENGFIIDIDITQDRDSSTATLNFDRLDKFLREASTILVENALSTIEFIEGTIT